MRVIYKGVGEAPQVQEIPNTLAALQAAVGGYIEAVRLSSNAAVICNEEGRINGMPHNCSFLGNDWYGPLLIVGTKGEEFCSLPQSSIVFLEALVRGGRT